MKFFRKVNSNTAPRYRLVSTQSASHLQVGEADDTEEECKYAPNKKNRRKHMKRIKSLSSLSIADYDPIHLSAPNTPKLVPKSNAIKIAYARSNYESIAGYTSNDNTDSDHDEEEKEACIGLVTPKSTPKTKLSSTPSFTPKRRNILYKDRSIHAKLDHLELTPTTIIPPKNSDGSITINTVKLANRSGFELFNAAFTTIQVAKDNIIENQEKEKENRAIYRAKHAHNIQLLKRMSAFMNARDRFIMPYFTNIKDEWYYIFIHFSLILLDILLFILELMINIMMVYAVPSAGNVMKEYVMNCSYYINKLIWFVMDIFALNDWTERESWKSRARALYQNSAQRHMFFLVADVEEETFGHTSRGDNGFFGFRNTRKIIERQRSATIINTDIGNCLICLLGKKEMALKECGHIVCCKNCIKGLKKCPVCRTNIATPPLRLYT